MQSHAQALHATPQRVAALDRLGDEIAELSAHLEAATARLLELIREFDARGGWNTGFRSCAAWLSWRVGLDLGAAREKVRVARALGTLPLLAEALARGELSYAKVRALTRVATPETEARLLAVGRAGTAAHVERIVRGWRQVDRKAEARESARRHAGRALHVHQDEDGMVVLRGRLTPEVGALLLRALAAAREALYQRTRGAEAAVFKAEPCVDRPTTAQQQADALALLAETALHQGLDPGAPGELDYESCTVLRTEGRAATTSLRHWRTRAMFSSAFSGIPPRDTWAMNSSRVVVINNDALISNWIAWTHRVRG
ncbi:MAG: hypothetical protein A2X53_18780 [Candidatus Rokubacteria bacterium GWA2_70_23]|nr:MAG: hypothetical protein A2X53_18780 [Candidatus Rokubacteria bacterium GWA2_70_23]